MSDTTGDDGVPPPDRTEGLWDDAMAEAFDADMDDSQTRADEPPSVLVRLQARLGEAPECVHLPDELLDEEGTMVINAQSREVGQSGRRVGRYMVFGELARGGMGVVLHGRDVDLGRDVAIKVLREEYADQSAMIQRFIEEAQVAGQLQHPGVIPVYEIGLDASRRPFFSMKLVRGRTLSALLRERPGLTSDLPRLLSVFEQVSQTLAYAHARRVVHRDVKPSNVMVGAFGEVQVMDWGMAKVLTRGGVDDEGPEEDPLTRIETVRSDGRGSQSIAGSVLGTPSYMPPEQARGHVAVVDERADVFALGGILCEILTGEPPYTRHAGSSAMEQAQSASLEPVLDRLDAAETDPDLVRLARWCLQPDLRDRPRDAAAVAREMAGYLESTERRVEEARVEARAASVRVLAERKARRLTVALAASAVVVVILVGGVLWWNDARRSDERARNDRQVGAAIRDADGHMAARRWGAARAALQAARGAAVGSRVTEEVAAELRAAGERLVAEQGRDEARAEAAARDAAFVARLRETRNRPVVDPALSDDEYAEAFERRGVYVDKDAAARVAEIIRAQAPTVREAMIFGLDDWAGRRRLMGDEAPWRRLVRTARLADDDVWRSGLRDALLADQTDRLKALAAQVHGEEQPPGSLVLLAVSLSRSAERDVALDLLRRSCVAHPRDYWVHQQLAVALVGEFKKEGARRVRQEASLPAELEEAETHLRIALVLQPDSTFNMAFLATVMHRRGQSPKALAYVDQRLAEFPDDEALKVGKAQILLDDDPNAAVAELRGMRGGRADSVMRRARESGFGLPDDPEQEISRLQREVLRRPDNGPLRTDLARMLLLVGALEGAEKHGLAATGLRGNRPEAWHVVGRSNLERGNFELAAQAFQTARDLGLSSGRNLEMARTARRLADRAGEFRRHVETGESPRRFDSRVDFARFCCFTGRYAPAVASFKRLMEERARGSGRRPPREPPGRGPRFGRSRGFPPPDMVVDAGLAGVRAGDLKFARTCLGRLLGDRDDGPPRGGREPRVHGLELHRWLHDRRFVSVRDGDALAAMDPAERDAWTELWDRVRAAVRRPR